MAEVDKTEDNKVRGCQSQVWMTADMQDGHIQISAESDALIVQGLIAVLLRVYSGRSPGEIISSDTTFLSQIGLDRHLSVSRTNGLHAMLTRIRQFAAACQEQA